MGVGNFDKHPTHILHSKSSKSQLYSNSLESQNLTWIIIRYIKDEIIVCIKGISYENK